MIIVKKKKKGRNGESEYKKIESRRPGHYMKEESFEESYHKSFSISDGDPMVFEVLEIGVDSGGHYVRIRTIDTENGRKIIVKMYEGKTYTSEELKNDNNL